MLQEIDLNEKTYPPGSLLIAKDYPLVQLRVIAYLQRIYYCEKVGYETDKQVAYFHRELQLPR